MRSRQVLLVLAVVCGLTVMATGTSAEVVATGENVLGDDATYTAPSSIIQGLTASARGGGTPIAAGDGFADIAQMNDGAVGTAKGANTQCLLLDSVTPTVWAVWTLDTSVHTAGYDIDSIQSFAGFNQNRAWQSLEIKYALAGDVIGSGSELGRTLGTFTYNPAGFGLGYNATHMTIADNGGGKVLTGVIALEVKFVDNNFHQGSTVNMTSYRELSVVGSASPIPEPSSIMLLAFALIGLVAHAWRKRR